MKNVTLSADEDLIEEARSVARSRNTTLNEAFREWLVQFTARRSSARRAQEFLHSLRHVDSGGRRFTRDEMNVR
jgi:hypothetical protein